MTEIKLLNKIGKAGVDRFDGAKYTLSEDAAAPAGILVRSAAMHEMAFGPELLAIARAGAGVNNIPLDRCSEQALLPFEQETIFSMLMLSFESTVSTCASIVGTFSCRTTMRLAAERAI